MEQAQAQKLIDGLVDELVQQGFTELDACEELFDVCVLLGENKSTPVKEFHATVARWLNS